MQTPFEEDYYGRTEALDTDDLEQIQYEQQARQEQQMMFEEQAAEEAEAEAPTSTSNRGEGSTATPTPETQPEKKQEKPAEQSTDDTRGKSGGDGLSRYGDMVSGGAEELAKAAKTSMEFATSSGAGVIDWGIDLINKIPKKEIPGIDNPFTNDQGKVPKIPKFENEVAQSFREVSSVLLPTIFISRGLKGNINAATAGPTVLSNPLSRFIGGTALDLGVGAAVDYVAETNEKDDNLTGTLKKSFPKTFGWISEDIATLDGDSPDVKRNKNLTEGAWLGLFSSGIEAVANIVKAGFNRAGVRAATKWVPENEKAKNYLRLNDEVSTSDVDETIAKGIAKRDFALDEVGEYNLYSKNNLDEPLLGVHDVYSGYESAVRTTDNLGIVGASMDVARIAENADTLYGRVGSVVSDGALKFVNAAGDSGHALIKGLAETLKGAGEYGYKVSDGRYISHAQQMDIGEKLAADWVGLPLEDLKKAVGYEQRTGKYGTPELTDQGYAGVMKTIKAYNKEFANMDYYRASGIVAASMAGQVSDFAQTMRLMPETAVIERAQEMILDRIEFLMAQKGMTSYSAGRALNMLNIFNRKGKAAKKADEIAEAMAESEKRMAEIALEAKETVATMRAISAERPEMLNPFMLAYDLTDGDINSMTKLNNYVRQSTGMLSKAFFDGQSEIPSAFMKAAWGNVYNSVLSSIATPIKAVIGNTLGLVERPIATFAGALVTGDIDTIKRGMYMYSAVGDSLLKGFTQMKRSWNKAVTNPQDMGPLMRTDFETANLEQLEILDGFADAKAAEGMYGPQAMMVQVHAMEDMAQSPWFRFGINAMTAFDGFTQAMIGNAEARARAYDMWKAGLLEEKELADAVANKVYNEMWDKAGNMTDKAAAHATKEIALNLDSKSVDAISGLLNRAPVLKPFMLFPKTSVNDLKWAGSHNPLGLFVNELHTFGKPFKEQPIERVKELLTSRGITYDQHAEAAYNTIRAELKGRKAIGTLAVAGAIGWIMNDGLRGNGHFDKERQKFRTNALGWKPRTIKNPITGQWVSYDNLGALTTWIAFVADVADNMDTLDPSDMATMFNKAGYVLSANLTNKTFLAGIEPMFDMLSGNPAAMNRWAASFGSGLFPLSGLRNDFSRILAPQMKELDQELFQLLSNRNPIAKNTLPDQHDWIDGGLVNEPENFFDRVWNTFMPWKVSSEMSERKKFLMEIEFDAQPSLRTNGRGVEYTPEERSQVTDMMGQRGDFRRALDRIMRSKDGKEFRELYRRAQKFQNSPDLREKLEKLHSMIEAELRSAQDYAETQIAAREEIKNKQYYNSVVGSYLERGDLAGAEAFQAKYPQYQYLK